MIINNMPMYAREYEYVVVRVVDGEMWFWGAWNKENKAYQVAVEIGGMVVACR